MNQLWAWEYEGQDEFGYKMGHRFEGIRRFMRIDSGTSGFIRDTRFITNLRKVKVVDEDVATKTYLTTDQFIKVWQSLDESKQKELHAARDAAWYAAWYANLAVLVRDKISDEQFEILTKPWTSCGLSLYAEDWDEVLNPKVVEPKSFGAIVEAETVSRTVGLKRRKFVKLLGVAGATWFDEKGGYLVWSDLINPTIISEGVEG